MKETVMEDHYEMSQSEVARSLNMTQQNISRIEKQAIESLKQAFRSKNINVKDLLEN